MTDQEKLDHLVTDVAVLITDVSYIKQNMALVSPLCNRVTILEENLNPIKKMFYGILFTVGGILLTAIIGLVII